MMKQVLTASILMLSMLVGASIPAAEASGTDQHSGHPECAERLDSSMMTMRYDFTHDVVFDVFTRPGGMTEIVLEPGEKIVSMPFAGAEDRWKMIVDGSRGDTLQQRVLVRAYRHNCSAGLMIETDRRHYHINLCCSSDAWMERVVWNYRNALTWENSVSNSEISSDSALR
ncbi:TrbG/VirB9 family P-type conjugative transfer protein [Prosthecochloris sp. HL-130-GSB]|jgi:type IV secretion system protein TrbG|uniref:TrbG/VirB9 family P-type conjugative transfer protein n=1 Tax=Prosthecochloris sp. HL-130-GSB TaxID=1974213 RepID=UPI000A1C0B22|nr:TrbG/VirB9 family P-type conjugative transfer protein [Prosthecochloris sp. HL-130-GSB]ARM31047.1 hypothetical protein B9H02_06720 [Prosthecochloris sp. HL-130-GSB]